MFSPSRAVASLELRALICSIFVCTFLVACTHTSPPPERSAAAMPHVLLSPDGSSPTTVSVEVARTPQETQRGLMFRDHLDAGKGMLFLFDHPHHLEFWMHNTYVALDMIFITADRKVLGVVAQTQPLTDEPRGVEGDSQFVLEVPAGFAGEHRIVPGTPVRFVDID